jgi:CBS domain-containing protein
LTDLSVRVPASSVEADLLRDRIERLWPKSPCTVGPDTPVGDVLQKMVGETIGCVMVADRGKLVGIFSERDALMKLNTDAPKMLARPISQFMTPDPVTLETGDKIAFALHKMNVGGYRHIPILFDGKLAGVISIRDILRYLTERIAAAGRR